MMTSTISLSLAMTLAVVSQETWAKTFRDASITFLSGIQDPTSIQDPVRFGLARVIAMMAMCCGPSDLLNLEYFQDALDAYALKIEEEPSEVCLKLTRPDGIEWEVSPEAEVTLRIIAEDGVAVTFTLGLETPIATDYGPGTASREQRDSALALVEAVALQATAMRGYVQHVCPSNRQPIQP